ncbi:MAG: hypothetical protein WB471_01600, partial [Nocardioides sp.]
MRRHRHHATAVLAAVALSVTACSGGDREPVTEGGATSAGGAAATEPGTALDFGDRATLVWQPTT